MVLYRRNRIAGGTYFFTVNLADRSARTLVDHIRVLRDAFGKAKRHLPFKTVAIVVLPDHLHAVWKLPDGDADFPARWRAIKAHFTHGLSRAGVWIPKHANGEHAIWQRRFWEHTIRDDEDLERHVNYIHYNPVKHGHTVNASDWPHSSLHRYIRKGVVQAGWGGGERPVEGRFGE